MDHQARAQPTPPRVRRVQLSDEVAARLRADIITGAIRCGTYIRLGETAAQLGVSITPVREALRTLRGEGMVRLEPYRGHIVVSVTGGEVEDIHWLQATIVKELAATATNRITEAEIDDLARLNDALATAIEQHDPERIACVDSTFHQAFNRAARRTKLSWFLQQVARNLPGQTHLRDPRWYVSTLYGHVALIAALRRRDVDTVVRLSASAFKDCCHGSPSGAAPGIWN